jgi:hypothetical protein
MWWRECKNLKFETELNKAQVWLKIFLLAGSAVMAPRLEVWCTALSHIIRRFQFSCHKFDFIYKKYV